ncbi:unnamed protein product [Lathyrus oleraceus]
METENESTIGPNWLDLPRDLTANILHRLGTDEILSSACQVCSLWWNISKDPLMWRTIKMGNRHTSYDDAYLEKICYNAVNRSCDHLEEIDIECFGTDSLLECIANNGSHLHSMRLIDCWSISDEGFSEAVRKLPQLETVDISLTNLHEDSLEVLGRSCPLLKSLQYCITGPLTYRKSNAIAFVIAETMSGLCDLDIEGHGISDVGLIAILDKCPLLKYLDTRGCLNLILSESLEKRCIDQFDTMVLPSPVDYYFNPYWYEYATSDDEY